MKTAQITVYICECCGRKFGCKANCLAHEPDCFEEKHRREEYARQREEAQKTDR